MRAFFLFLALLNLSYFAVGDYLVPGPGTRASVGATFNTTIPHGLVALHIIRPRLQAKPKPKPMAPSRPVAQAVPANTSAAPPKVVVSQPRLCYSLGPFGAKPKAIAMVARFKQRGVKARLRNIRQTQVSAYWIYLPPYPSTAAAAAVTRKLAAKGYHHYYIVVAAPNTNAVSLGLFRERSGANRRLARLRSLGFHPRLQVRTAVKDLYWLDYRSPDNATISPKLWANTSAGDGPLQRVRRNCGTG